MQRRVATTRVVTTSAAIVSILGGAYVVLSLFLYSLGFQTLPAAIARPGSFLMRSYNYLAYYIPVYLFVLGGMLLFQRLLKKTLFVMTAAVLPLLTFALVIQLTLRSYGPAAEVLAITFGPKIGATLMLLLGAAEIPAIYILTMHIFEGVRLFSSGETKLLAPPEQEIEDAGSSKESSIKESSIKEGAANEGPVETESFEEAQRDVAAEGWEQFDRPNKGISFPHIPEAPKLKTFEDPESGDPESEAPGSEEIDEALEIDLDKLRDPEIYSPGSQDFSETQDSSVVRNNFDYSSASRQKFEIEEEEEFRDYDSFEEYVAPGPDPDEVPYSELNRHHDIETGQDEDPYTGLSPDPVLDPDRQESGSAEVYEVVEVEPVSHTGPPPPKGAQLKLREAKPPKRFTYKNYTVPEEELLKEYPDRHYWVIDDETREWAEVLKHTLEEFKISAEVTGIQKGPVITMFEILPAPGVKLSKIVNLADNIALRLAASRVRIVAPIPGKHAVGIEVPNKKRALVSFKEMMQSEELKESGKKIPVILGKDITGETQIVDLTQTPHLLIAGATGSGKSVCVNSIICSVLYTRSPDEVRMVLIDPKIVELKLYNDIPHLLTPVITEAKRAFQALQYLLYEMERRYALLDSLGVRDIGAYNRKIKRKKLATQPLPYIVVIVDEFADLMATSGKELESTLARLAAMSRAVGLHLVLATQRPSIDVITGLIKANIPSRIAFMVANKFDSRIIIDSIGADKLLGQGDMLFTSAWNPHPTRIQGAYLSEEEVEHVADYVRTLGEPDYIDEEIFFDDDEEEWNGGESSAADDPLMNKALEVVASAGKASASYLQRRLKIGYNRAARLVEEMEQRGIVGPQNGSKPREILHIPEEHRPE